MYRNVQTLTGDQCLNRLSQQRIGRVSLSKDALPIIVPVDYARDGDSIIFRGRHHSMLAQACDKAVIAFEVDEISAASDTGWSVQVVGIATRLAPSERSHALTLGLPSVLGDEGHEFLRLRLARISGHETDLPLAGASTR
jgi:nitroimidazol reductase NimA-like FMN-containing flavoprotein (pyridoxamine 5'-phosphate oxidase superfamily)